MDTPRLVISYPGGRNETYELSLPVTTIGRRRSSTIQLTGTDKSRDHADIVKESRGWVLRDRGSRFGTYVNGQKVTEHVLRHRDRLRFGQNPDHEVVFVAAGADSEIPLITDSGDFRLLATMLAALHAIGAGRVLDDVLTMVVDSAIEITRAERGFIMLAGPGGQLGFTIGRGRGRVTLPGDTFEIARKIRDEVYADGRMRITDLTDPAKAAGHSQTFVIGIRQVLCVPLELVRLAERPESDRGSTRIGVLYLDSREPGVLTSPDTRSALEALAAEAAVAIENARLYREANEKARLEHELRIAAEIQRALMPRVEYAGPCFEVSGTSVPCRAVGGDFFDYLELEDGSIGVALGDVSGKGAAAALLTAVVQGMFTVEASVAVGPADTLARINRGLRRRTLDSRFVTLFCGVLSADGRLVYCNGGHNAPVLLSRNAVSRLETGGTILGLFDRASYDEETRLLEAGDTLLIFSDGIAEAQNAAGEDYGDDRLIACLKANRGASPADMREAVLASVREFAAGAPPVDDMTVLVLKYLGPVSGTG